MKLCVFGNPVEHSLSPEIHTAFARQFGEKISYEKIKPPLDGFVAAVDQFIAAGGSGANVTLPFKVQAYELTTKRPGSISNEAKFAKAVNTLRFDGIQNIIAHNTDGIGLVRDLQENLGWKIEGTRVLLLGAGGAVRGILFRLLQANPKTCVIANRTLTKAKELIETQKLESFRHKDGKNTRELLASSFEELTKQEPFDLIINATSSGITGEALSLSASIFAPNCLAYEILYGKQTFFMQLAAAHKAKVSDGLGMLVEQAAESFKLWTNKEPETKSVLANLRK